MVTAEAVPAICTTTGWFAIPALSAFRPRFPTYRET